MYNDQKFTQDQEYLEEILKKYEYSHAQDLRNSAVTLMVLYHQQYQNNFLPGSLPQSQKKALEKYLAQRQSALSYLNSKTLTPEEHQKIEAIITSNPLPPMRNTNAV